MFTINHNGVQKWTAVHPSLIEAYKDLPFQEVDALGKDVDGIFDSIDSFDVNGKPEFNLDKAKAIKIKQAQGFAADAMKAITDNYDAHEIATWDIQEAEARGNSSDNYLIGLAASSGVDIDTLKAKIIINADAYRTASANAVGKRQKMEAACVTATTIEELIAVVF